MKAWKKNLPLKLAVAIAFIAMVVFNYLAQGLPLNGRTPGEVSDSMPNLFAPAGFTFSIWGLIYLALGCFTVYQFGLQGSRIRLEARVKVRGLFILSSLGNIAWLLCWHYDYIGLSVVCMIILLISLALINLILDEERPDRPDQAFYRLPFSLYFGWITVATVANITAFLVRTGWNRFGLSQEMWMIVISLLAAVIGFAATVKRKDLAYGLVLVFGYTGILAKRLSTAGPAAGSGVITAVIVSLVILTIGVIYTAVAMVQGRGRLAAVKK